MKAIVVEDFSEIRENSEFNELDKKLRNIQIEHNIDEEGLRRYLPHSKKIPRKPSVNNLGIYLRESDDSIRTHCLVGIMPIHIDDKNLENKEFLKEYFWCVKSKWGNPFQMLEEILNSDERYDDKICSLLEPEEKKLSDWIEYSKDKEKGIKGKESDFLYGIVTDGDKIDITQDKGNSHDAVKCIGDSIGIIYVFEYLTQLEQICKRVLKQQSMPHEENLAGKVKGRILVYKQIKYNLSKGRIDRNYCSYNKMSIDNPENRILKYALYLCKKWSEEKGNIFSEKIYYCDNILKSVKLVKVTKADIRSVKNNGAFKEYKEGMKKAEAIIDHLNLSLESGKVEVNVKKVSPFFLRMDLLFELYCRVLIEKALKHISGYKLRGYGKESTSYLFYSEDEKENQNKEDYPVVGFQNKHIADFVIEKAKNRSVMDAKYSFLDEGYTDRIRENTHQLLAYTLLFDAKSCGFIYPVRDKNESSGNENSGKDIKSYELKIPAMSQAQETEKTIRLFSIGLQWSVEDQQQDVVEQQQKTIQECLKKIIC